LIFQGDIVLVFHTCISRLNQISPSITYSVTLLLLNSIWCIALCYLHTRMLFFSLTFSFPLLPPLVLSDTLIQLCSFSLISIYRREGSLLSLSYRCSFHM
jgi:hypothetical protein